MTGRRNLFARVKHISLAVLLALALVVAQLPQVASAADKDKETPPKETPDA
jgi:hypothetical protein